MRKGSITIFSLLSMMLVIAMLFALLEASRFHFIKDFATLQTQVALESVFAEYNTYLWEEYRILACNQGDVAERLETYGNRQIVGKQAGINFYQFRVKEAEVLGYTRLTDGKGIAFISAAAGYMKQNIAYETAKNIYQQYEEIKTIENQSEYSFWDIGKALENLKRAEEGDEVDEEVTKKQDIHTQESSSVRSNKNGKNILEFIQNIQKKGILSLVLKDEDSLSEKTFMSTDKVSNRSMPEEYHPEMMTVDWYSKVLFEQYILTYLSNYTDEKSHAMNYEVEYLLTGKNSDIENLKGAVTRLLAIRTAANFLYLSNHAVKKEQAGVLAFSIAGMSANPILIETVKSAILTAWAFSESILDIRTLLTGGKIALFKNDSSWTIDINAITKLGEGYLKAKNCKDGLSYKEYLGILLLLQQDEVIAMRTMDVQEQTLREKNRDLSICMENWIIEVKARVSYRYRPLFFSIEKVRPSWNYEIVTTDSFAY